MSITVVQVDTRRQQWALLTDIEPQEVVGLVEEASSEETRQIIIRKIELLEGLMKSNERCCIDWVDEVVGDVEAK